MYRMPLYRNCIQFITRKLFPGTMFECHYSKAPSKPIFAGTTDRFNGVTIDSAQEKCDEHNFINKLEDSLDEWGSKGHRCIWFKVNIKDSAFVPILAKKGFNFHHARDEFVMMYKWLPNDSTPNLPPAPHTNLGVGAMVFNAKNQILAISEKHYEYPHWKLPGGYVERGEDIIEAAVREVKEETGVDAKFQSMVTFRHTHKMMFGNSDIYILLMMKATMDKITVSQREINDCQWMDIEDYTNHPHVHEYNRLVIRTALDYKKRQLKINLQKKTVKYPTFVRTMDYMTVDEFDYKE